MIAYILKSSLSLLLLFGLYWFLLRKEKLFVFIRYFLLFSILLSLVLPFISIPVNIQAKEARNNIIILLNGNRPAINHNQNPLPDITKQYAGADSSDEALPAKFGLSQILLLVYILGLVLALFRFTKNIFKIYHQINLSESVNFTGRKLVLVGNQINPHCFFNTIFVCKQDYLNNKIAKEFLAHELEHIRQLHSIDIILLELIRIVYWFNPILSLYSRAIRVNHEYLADRGVLRDSPDVENYADKLLSLISCKETIPLTSGLNHSLMKRRLLMITKPESKSIIYRLRITVTLCMILVFFLLLSFKPSNAHSVVTGHKDYAVSLPVDDDSLKANMTISDLTPQSSTKFNKRITFTSSGYIKNDTINQTIVLVDNAIVSFGEITIKADSIVFDTRTVQIYATGRQGSSGTNIGKPVFKEGSQEMEADEITYNLNTRKAIATNVKTAENINLKDSASISEKNIHSNSSDFLFLNSNQLKPLGIELNRKGVFYKNRNPNWKQDKVRYSCLRFYSGSNNYLTTIHYLETDVIKAKNRNERLLAKMEITTNDFYPVLIGNTKGKQSLDNQTLPEDLKLFPVAICMSETKLRNRKDTIIVWFKPSEALRKALPENVNIEDYLKLPIRTK